MTPEQAIAEIDQIADVVAEGSFEDVLTRDVYPMVLDGIEQNFEESTTPEGQGWPPRKQPGDGHPLLILSGALKAAATGGTGHVRSIGPRVLVVGVDPSAGGGGVPGAGVHNFGFGEVAQREFMGVRVEVERRIEEVLTDAADEMMGLDDG